MPPTYSADPRLAPPPPPVPHAAVNADVEATHAPSSAPSAAPSPARSSPPRARTRIRLAAPDDRAAIYRMRHSVYAAELGQHATNGQRELRDALDAFNVYLVADAAGGGVGGDLAGFVSVTPPGHGRYSVDKYLPRETLPFACDGGLYEVRLLTVAPAHRRTPLAGLLMLAALRYVQRCGGTRVVAIGRREVLGVYQKAGLHRLGREVSCGAVTFELLTATVAELRDTLRGYASALRKLAGRIDWQLGVPMLEDDDAATAPAPAMLQPSAPFVIASEASDLAASATASSPISRFIWDDGGCEKHMQTATVPCFHGGAFFDAIGDDFATLERRHRVINADVLDAWFPPAPGVLVALREHLPWLVRTSPPTDCGGMIRAIAAARGVPAECLVPGGGSSDLIFLALRHWLTARSRVLLLDPTYGEYAHVLERVIGCRMDRLTLSRADDYAFHPADVGAYELVILVNPNSPTGRYTPRETLAAWLSDVVAPRTRVWIDETYVDYVGGPDMSLERLAAASANVVVCKSMSKVHALSGLRAGYLCGPARLMAELRAITPPWAVSLPAQVAAVGALADPTYYGARYVQTHALRDELAAAVGAMPGARVVGGAVANFLLVHLSEDGPDAATVVARCRRGDVFLRDTAAMGTTLGRHAIRIAVKPREEQERIIAALARAIHRRTHVVR